MNYLQNPQYAQYGGYAATRLYPLLQEQPQQIPYQMPVQEDSETDTLSSTLLVGTPLIAGVSGAKYIAHPIKSTKAAVAAQNTFKTLGLNTASNVVKANVYNNLLNAERMMDKVAPELKSVLETAYNNYKTAVKAGNAVGAAQHLAEMNTVIAQGKAPGFFGKLFGKTAATGEKAAEIAKAANEAGITAAKGATGLSTAVKGAETLSTMGKIKNWTTGALKSGGFKGMAIFEGILETFTNVIPAFQISAASGIKQIFKSSVSVAGSAAGWCIGAKGGAVAGAAIGTAICPGIGTAVGGFLGWAVGGLSGSWLGRKVAGLFTGKSEVDKAKEAQLAQAQMQQNIFMNGGQNLNTVC